MAFIVIKGDLSPKKFIAKKSRNLFDGLKYLLFLQLVFEGVKPYI
jgi:hypothetical protein